MRSARLVPWLVMSVSIVALSLTAPAAAAAQPVLGTGNGSGGAGLGVGAAAFLSGLAGVEVVYDQPRWHIEGLLGFDSRDGNGPGAPSTTNFTFGVRGWYHLHQGTNSDFSVGGGVGFDHFSASLNNNTASGTETFFEPGAEARVFLTPNFALFGLAGFTLAFGDVTNGNNTGIALASQVNAAFGFTYFFR
jgi:hypothetical protein